jgi:Tfp pilus assembly protein PilX
MIGRWNFSDSWQSGIPRAAANPRVEEKLDNRGVALVITLLLLFLMSALGLAAVLATSSDLLINGYYANYRASFYAADSGLNIARESMANTLNIGTPAWNPNWNSAPCGNVPISYVVANPAQFPLTAGSATTALLGLNNYENSSSPTLISGKPPSLFSGQTAVQGVAANSWVESFYVSTAAAYAPSVTLALVTVACPVNNTPSSFTFTYTYSLTTVG